MAQLRLMSTSRRRGPVTGVFKPLSEAHEKPEHSMSVSVALQSEPFDSQQPAQSSLSLPSQQTLAKARWIAESDPRVSVMVARREVVVSSFVSAPHARSGGWTLGIRYMTSSRNGLELLVSAVVDLFSGELVSLATFEPMAGAGGF
jgi:hypothetical protein